MDYKKTTERLAEYRRQIGALRGKMREAQTSIEPEEVRGLRVRDERGHTATLRTLWQQE